MITWAKAHPWSAFLLALLPVVIIPALMFTGVPALIFVVWLIAFVLVQARDNMAGVKPFLIVIGTAVVFGFMAAHLGVFVILPLSLILLMIVIAAAIKLSRVRWL
jgi:hypothetical protein